MISESRLVRCMYVLKGEKPKEHAGYHAPTNTEIL